MSKRVPNAAVHVVGDRFVAWLDMSLRDSTIGG
jgi:hypothetical protein